MDTTTTPDVPILGKDKTPPKQGRIIKYLGSADIRKLLPGETLLGAVTVPLGEELMWKAPYHLLDTAKHPDVHTKFWDALLTFTDWRDVTDVDLEEHPQSDWERTFSPRITLLG